MALAKILGLMAATLSAAAPLGDRHPRFNGVFPPELFLHAGQDGRIIDVTKPPFGAKGDGVTDDTAAQVKAYDFVLAQMDQTEWSSAGPESTLCEYIIYLPNGTAGSAHRHQHLRHGTRH